MKCDNFDHIKRPKRKENYFKEVSRKFLCIGTTEAKSLERQGTGHREVQEAARGFRALTQASMEEDGSPACR